MAVQNISAIQKYLGVALQSQNLSYGAYLSKASKQCAVMVYAQNVSEFYTFTTMLIHWTLIESQFMRQKQSFNKVCQTAEVKSSVLQSHWLYTNMESSWKVWYIHMISFLIPFRASCLCSKFVQGI